MSQVSRLHVIVGGFDRGSDRGLAPVPNPAPDPASAPAPTPARVPELLRAPEPLPAPEPLWREVLGDRLRELRRQQGETLAETAARAGISPQYLSEVERGLKEPSSEMIAAVAGALGTTLGGLAESVADELRAYRVARTEAVVLATRIGLAPRRGTSGPVHLALAA